MRQTMIFGILNLSHSRRSPEILRKSDQNTLWHEFSRLTLTAKTPFLEVLQEAQVFKMFFLQQGLLCFNPFSVISLIFFRLFECADFFTKYIQLCLWRLPDNAFRTLTAKKHPLLPITQNDHTKIRLNYQGNSYCVVS